MPDESSDPYEVPVVEVTTDDQGRTVTTGYPSDGVIEHPDQGSTESPFGPVEWTDPFGNQGA